MTPELTTRIAKAIAEHGSAAYTSPSGAVLKLMTELANEGNLGGFASAFVILSQAKPRSAAFVAAAVPAKISDFLLRYCGISTPSFTEWTKATPDWSDTLKDGVRDPARFERVVEDMAMQIRHHWERVCREHFSGRCGPLAQLLHERHGWPIYRITTSFEGSPRVGADHVFIRPAKGGILDALGWTPDFDDGLNLRCKAQLLVDDPQAEEITAYTLTCIINKRAIGGLDGVVTRIELLNRVGDDLSARYYSSTPGGFQMFDPF